MPPASVESQGDDDTDPTGAPINLLATAASTYLRASASDHIAWQPWGDGAFERGSADQLRFVAIGFAACHNCHRMHDECFTNEAVCSALRRYVPVKVDREESGDVDAHFQRLALDSKGVSGWPLHAIVTGEAHDGHPAGSLVHLFFRCGPEELQEMLTDVADRWAAGPESRSELLRAAQAQARSHEQAARADEAGGQTEEAMGPEGALEAAIGALEEVFDATHGGFSAGCGGDKLPKPATVAALLSAAYAPAGPGASPLAVQNARRAAQIGLRTLQRVVCGGLHDVVSGGFFRYATTTDWRHVHYEKMLSDQAEHMLALCAAGAVTRHTARARLFQWAASHTADFVIEEMGGEAGGLFCAALSAGHGADDAAYYRAAHSAAGATAPHPQLSIDAGLDVFEQPAFAEQRMAEQRAQRERPPPGRDRLVLARANGAMLSALCALSRWLQERDETAPQAARYLRAASACADGLRTLLFDGTRLLHAFGSSRPADLLSHARVCAGLVAYFEASGDLRALETARAVARCLLSRFHCADAGTGTGAAATSRFCEPRDPRLPPARPEDAFSVGAAEAILALRRLALHTPTLDGLCAAVASAASRAPWRGLVDAHTAVRWAAARRSALLTPVAHVAISHAPSEAQAAIPLLVARRMREAAVSRPIVLPGGPSARDLEAWQGHAQHPVPASGARAFPCVGERCMPPARTPDSLAAALDAALWRAADVDSNAPQEVDAMGVLQSLKSCDGAALERALAQDPQGARRKDQAGRTPLVYAAVLGDDEAVEMLLARGAEVNTVADDGLTALHHAAIAGSATVCRLLLAGGADAAARSHGMQMKLGGSIPLSLPSGKTAAELASSEEVRQVLESGVAQQAQAGAQPDLQDQQPRTPPAAPAAAEAPQATPAAPAAAEAPQATPAAPAAAEAPCQRPLLVLDLDGTLLDTTPAGTRVTTRFDFTWRGREVRLRPGLAAFVSAVVAHGFDTAVWTAAPADYAEAMVAGMARCGVPLHPQLILSDNDCERSWSSGPVVRKPLSKLSRRLGTPVWRMLVLDDTPTTYAENESNAIPVPTFTGRSSDDVLGEVQAFLLAMDLGAPLDVRGWRLAPRAASRLSEPAPPRRLGTCAEEDEQAVDLR